MKRISITPETAARRLIGEEAYQILENERITVRFSFTIDKYAHLAEYFVARMTIAETDTMLVDLIGKDAMDKLKAANFVLMPKGMYLELKEAEYQERLAAKEKSR